MIHASLFLYFYLIFTFILSPVYLAFVIFPVSHSEDVSYENHLKLRTPFLSIFSSYYQSYCETEAPLHPPTPLFSHFSSLNESQKFLGTLHSLIAELHQYEIYLKTMLYFRDKLKSHPYSPNSPLCISKETGLKCK